VRILVVEDEPAMADLLQRALSKEGHAVDVVGNGEDAIWSGTEIDYDAIVLDAMIPEPDGFAVCRELRGRERWMPILMLTARDGVDDRVRGLDAGADDYLVKPFALAELFARLRSLARRDPVPRPTVIEASGIALDPATHTVRRNNVPIELSPTEFSLLAYLIKNANRAVSRTEILEHVWDFAYDGTSNVVDVYIRYLREKLDRPFGTNAIETVRGVGYMIADERSDDSSNSNDETSSVESGTVHESEIHVPRHP
jgi:two-component system, OmpR family, response regulator